MIKVLIDNACCNCYYFHFGSCNHPSNYKNETIEADLVYGSTKKITYKKRRQISCWNHRQEGRILCRLDNTCGKEGRWFEPKVINRNNTN